MSLTVEVALIANEDAPFEPGPIDSRHFAQPYSARPRVRIQADSTESLASVLERAADEMNLVPPHDSWMGGRLDCSHRKVLFKRPEDDEGPIKRSRGRLYFGELILVDDRGRAILGVHDLRGVRYSDLLRAAEAGTIEGDPLLPYLILDDGWGDAPPMDWSTLLEGLDVAWDVMEGLAIATGASAGAFKASGWLRDRIGRGRAAVRDNAEWCQRGFRPDQFEALLAQRKWRSEEIAELLGCSAEQAEGALGVLGYTYSDEAAGWEYHGDDSHKALVALAEAVATASHGGGDWRTRFGGWLQLYIETGEPPPPSELDPYASVEEPSAEDANGGLLRRGRALIEGVVSRLR